MAENRPWRGRNGVSTAQLLGVTAGGCCISSVRSGSTGAAAPASTLPGEVQIPRCHAHFCEFRSFADLNCAAEASTPRAVDIPRGRVQVGAPANGEGELCLR